MLRYRGDPSMWAWLLHRLTGVGIFVFLLVHVVDTALIGWGRDLYDTLVRLYHHPVFRVGEILLFGAVLFHGLNGLRVVVMDFIPSTTSYQRQMLAGVVALFLLTFIPAGLIMVGQMLHGGESLSVLESVSDLKAWLPTLIVAIATLSVYTPTFNLTRPQLSIKPTGGLEFYGWLFIRVSGVLLIFLVLGHLVVMHLMESGVNRVNYDFIAQRLTTPFWRTYDFVLLVLAVGHGTWGMRNVLLDYIHRPLPRLVALSLLYTASGIVVVLGAIVLFTFQPS
ncbi:MAG: succinate dehydrogenase, cytochrome b556 subunit [Candidatus Fervidibacter sp.]|uniref:succinate dehydrogenase, cytochrome b556 subunit n=1 Tax=Candidatus Fervidibacter sp. TaxID=3100871 RepID=UPI00404A985E